MMSLLDEIARGENVGIEFKEARPNDSLKYTKTVVAFANGRGGRILFGVENDSGRIVGIPREKVSAEMDAIIDTIENTCTPTVSVDVKPAIVDGKCLIAVDVRRGEKTPYYVKALGMRKGTFVRIGATSRQAEEYALKNLILVGENLSFDGQAVPRAALSKDELASTCALMTDVARRNCRDDVERKALKAMTVTRLASLGLIVRKREKFMPTYALRIVNGGDLPDIMPPRIKCGCFRGTSKGDFVDRRTCEGPLVGQIDEAFDFVVRNIRVSSVLVGTGRRDIYELPLDAIREAICNAAFHRDYLAPSCTYVALYDDRLEILSPGGLVRDISLEDAISGFSKIRNVKMGAALEYMKEVEGWGGGISRYFTSCADMGLPTPKVVEEAGFLKIVFFRRSKFAKRDERVNDGVNEGVNADERVNERVNERVSERVSENAGSGCEGLLELITAHPGRRTNDFSQMMGKSKQTISRYLRTLKDRELIEFIGAPKTGGYYCVKAV